MKVVWGILGMGVITYLIRLVPLALADRLTFSPRVRLALTFVPTAVLAAIIGPEVFWSGGALDLSLGNERFIAGVVATAVAWRTGHVIATIGAGMVVLWVMQAL